MLPSCYTLLHASSQVPAASSNHSHVQRCGRFHMQNKHLREAVRADVQQRQVETGWSL